MPSRMQPSSSRTVWSVWGVINCGREPRLMRPARSGGLSRGRFGGRLVHQFLAHLGFDLVRHRVIGAQQLAGVLASLPDALALVGIPGAELLDDILFGRNIDQLALLGNPRPVEDIEL